MGHRTITAIIFIILSVKSAAQQIPVSENYFLDKFSLSSSYAGRVNPGTIFIGFRSDWTGVNGGPKTYKVSYSDLITSNAGFGGRIIYDMAGIFDQIYLMGSYSYNLVVSGEHRILFALSAGLYRNSINYTDHYNDPSYNLDPVMTQQDVISKLKFMSDYSAVYMFKNLEAGVMFANITFGDARYREIEATYKPFANYQVHATYSIQFSDKWSLDPLIFLRCGKYILSQAGIASRIVYRDIIWVSFGYRDRGIWGSGLGASIGKGLQFSYHFNMASSVPVYIFNNHEFSIAINIKDLIRKGSAVPESTVTNEQLF